MNATPEHWLVRYGTNVERRLGLARPRLVGVLNLTPDSFSDGGALASPQDALHAGLAMIEAGASVLDVGGESTRPGAIRVSVQEQVRRVVPTIELLRRAIDALGAARSSDGPATPEVFISIDTTLEAVAAAAFDAGADALNDVSAGLESPRILNLCAARGRGVILMHRRVRPDQDSFSTRYGHPGERAAPSYVDVVHEVGEFLATRALAAIEAGVPQRSIVIDPGLGFGKTVDQNLELAGRVGELVELGYPVLVGASRKSFLGPWSGSVQANALGVAPLAAEHTPRQRDPASVALAGVMAGKGARLVRVHNVGAHRGLLG
jgi:dihydropteroate synthase